MRKTTAVIAAAVKERVSANITVGMPASAPPIEGRKSTSATHRAHNSAYGTDSSSKVKTPPTRQLGVRLAYRADALRKLRAKDVAALLAGLERGPQAQLAAMADPRAVAAALAELGPENLDALLSELDESDRARLQGLLARRPQ
jgi:hypothetical protein